MTIRGKDRSLVCEEQRERNEAWDVREREEKREKKSIDRDAVIDNA